MLRFESAMERACHRRYPAWTLYARAFSGNRLDAESIVQRAVAHTSRSARLDSEPDAHQRVLSSIRRSALPIPEPFSAEAASVLDVVRNDAPRAATACLTALRNMTRWQRRGITMMFLRRPHASLESAAGALRTTPSTLAASIERALSRLASAVHGARRETTARSTREHLDLGVLVAYVNGALSGDEARAAVAHARTCGTCGDRLGVLIALTSSAAHRTRTSRLSHSQRRMMRGFAAATGLLGGVFILNALWPNPWAEHATTESVPSWFHDFFYGGRKADKANDVSRGLELIVDGDFDSAIATLEPLVATTPDDAEAAAYLGIAHYLSGHTSRRTVRLLETGLRSHRAGRLSRWYLANALLARRDVHRARVHLEALASVGDWFGRAALELLERLEVARETTAA